ncbi:hypothetical protein GWI33_003012 [Rhynchophorus ferrugineus]|uniref:Malate dehydrogenase, mitochondrial n=1 Tax=Rhynchophorus ferrugineus TaxID=354439 RepID=A0A834IJR9_RHYFE|nr:hypothetical protein GWI33_003012 [Rhynchophorus ferrugineus]
MSKFQLEAYIMWSLTKPMVFSLKKYLGLSIRNRLTHHQSSGRSLMKVAVVGAAGKIGQALCLMLKQSPLIDELSIHDLKSTTGLGLELNHIDTKCKVSSHTGRDNLQIALQVGVYSTFILTFLCYFALRTFNAITFLSGYPDIVETAYVSSNLHPYLKYLSSPLLLGPNGITKNLGIPPLTDFEQCMFDHAVPLLANDIKKGEKLVGVSDPPPPCDPCGPPRETPCPHDWCEMKF